MQRSQDRVDVPTARLHMYPAWVATAQLQEPKVYTPMGTLAYVGSAPRTGFMKAKRRHDEDFAEFAHGINLDVASLAGEFRNFEPNLKATHKALAKFGVPRTTSICPRAMQVARSFLTSHFYPVMSGSHVIDQQTACASLDMSTSPGWPWSEQYGCKGDFMESVDYQYLHEYWVAIHHGVRPLTVFSVAGKEELRPTEKVLLGKGRGICGSAVELTVATKRYCSEMNDKMHRAHGTIWSMVGLNIQDGGWNALIQRLRRHPLGFSTDNVAYDTSIVRELFEVVRDFRWSCVEQSIPHAEKRAAYQAFCLIYEDTINSVLISPEGDMWEKLFGNPSGAANTTTDNTLVLFLALSYAWARNAPSDAASNYSTFMANVEAGLYGDDNIASVSTLYSPYFNPTTIRDSFAELGLTVENAEAMLTPIEQLSFLSRTSVLVGRVYYPIPINELKGLCSLAFRADKVHSPAVKFSRVCALRMQYLFRDNIYRIMDAYAQWLLKKYSPLYSGDDEWRLAMSFYLDHKTLFSLYSPRFEAFTPELSLCAADGQIKENQPIDFQVMQSKKNAKAKANKGNARARRSQARALATPVPRRPYMPNPVYSLADMVAHPCDAPLVSGLFGTVEGLMGRFKSRISNGTTNQHGYLLWVPAYHCRSPSTPTGANQTFNVFGFTTGDASANPIGINFSGPAWSSTNTAGFREVDPVYPFVVGSTCQDARVVSACMRLTNWGQEITSQGEVVAIDNVPLSAVLGESTGLSASVNDMFNLGRREMRLGLNTLEVVYRGSDTDACFRSDAVAPATSAPALVGASTAPVISPAVGNDGPRCFGFAWRAINANPQTNITFELIKNVEWRPALTSGMSASVTVTHGPSLMPTVHAVLDSKKPGWHMKQVGDYMMSGINMARSAMQNPMMQTLGNAALGYGMQQGLKQVGMIAAEAAPLLLL